MKRMVIAAAAALMVAATPVAAQTTGVDFIQALRSRDDARALEIARTNPLVVNARDSQGETPLMVTIGLRDEDWTGYLLNNKADPNLSDNKGDTPLIVAARIGFDTAMEWLLTMGARVDEDNRMGETALIVAVQRRQVPAVKLLLEAGANPDKADSAAGYSARDYARRDTRTPQILRLIEASKPAAR